MQCFMIRCHSTYCTISLICTRLNQVLICSCAADSMIISDAAVIDLVCHGDGEAVKYKLVMHTDCSAQKGAPSLRGAQGKVLQRL